MSGVGVVEAWVMVVGAGLPGARVGAEILAKESSFMTKASMSIWITPRK